MNKKTILILISILYVCIFGMGIILIRYGVEIPSEVENVGGNNSILLSMDVESESDKESEAPAETEIQIEIETEIETEIEIEIETETETQTEIQSETMTESEVPSVEEIINYTFKYSKGKKNLNIRKGPSLNDEIIGKVPGNGSGKILEFVNDEWVLIEYNGIVGYCSKELITVNEER